MSKTSKMHPLASLVKRMVDIGLDVSIDDGEDLRIIIHCEEPGEYEKMCKELSAQGGWVLHAQTQISPYDDSKVEVVGHAEVYIPSGTAVMPDLVDVLKKVAAEEEDEGEVL